jgi:molybdenum cofactor cytidylyltransferase
MKDLAIIILAAGKSSRMVDATKQLVKYYNQSLIRLACSKAIEISKNVYVVLGYQKEECFDEIKDLNVNVIYNQDFEKGIGTSISCAVNELYEYENVMITLCDQPFISPSHFVELIKNIDSQNIISTIYEESKNSTVPAIFPKKYYNELIKLNKDIGAKKIINENKSINIKLKKELSVDIDTIEDVDKFLSK